MLPSRLVLEKFDVWFDSYMRPRNLPDGDHDKVIWMWSRDLLTRQRENRISRCGGDVPQQHFRVLYLGLTGDVEEACFWNVVDTYHWDVLVMYHWDVVGCFIWDLFETSWRRTDGTSFLRPFEKSLRHSNKTPWRRTSETSWRRSIKTSMVVSFGTYQRRSWEVQSDVVTTSARRLNAGWVCLSVIRHVIIQSLTKYVGSKLNRADMESLIHGFVHFFYALLPYF